MLNRDDARNAMKAVWDCLSPGRQDRPRFGRLLLAGIAAASVIWGCSGGSIPEKPAIKRPLVSGIATAVIALSEVDDVYDTTGTVRADYVSAVASRIMGKVTALYVREGQRVQKGEVLLRIENEDLSQKALGASMALESARQNRDLAEITWQRYRKLHEERALSQQEMDQVEAQKKVAQSEYERARAATGEAGTALGFSSVRAPLAGVVTNRAITEGSMAIPGQTLLTIENPTSLYMECFVDERFAGRLKRGASADITFDGSRRLRGAIREIVPAVDPRSRTFLVKIGLATDRPEGGLRSGLFGRIGIPVGKKAALLVPGSALVQKGQLTGLFVVAPDGVVIYRLVKAGRAYPPGNIEILSGLAAGERIVVEGVANAVDGGVVQGASAR